MTGKKRQIKSFGVGRILGLPLSRCIMCADWTHNKVLEALAASQGRRFKILGLLANVGQSFRGSGNLRIF
jgi:hypothetical protein